MNNIITNSDQPIVKPVDMDILVKPNPIEISLLQKTNKTETESKSEDSAQQQKLEDDKRLARAEVAINEALFSKLNEKMTFSIDDDTGKTVIKIIDKTTDELIRQIPPQQFLDMVHNFNKLAAEITKNLPKFI